MHRFDFSEVPVIDTHVHGPISRKIKELFGLGDKWYDYFVEQLLPPGKSEDPSLKKEVALQMETRLATTSLFHYLSESYGVRAGSRKALENEIASKIKRLGIREFTRQSYSREKIKWVLVDHSFVTLEPKPKMDDFPADRTKWTHTITHMIQPEWAVKRDLFEIETIVSEIDKDLRIAKSNNCSGLKSLQAYFRDFSLVDVSEEEATRALELLRKARPKLYINQPTRYPVFEKSDEIRALKTYQDFMLRRIFCTAGKLKIPMVLHTAVSVAPQLKPWFNDPRKMYSIFDNEEIRRARTQFLLIHTGYPEYHIVSSLISQYPNVFVDLSHYSVDLSYLNSKILGEFLSIASPRKIMHGSDTTHPDLTAFGAHNTRVALEQMANWLFDVEHWTKNEITEVAELILFKNAERLFGR